MADRETEVRAMQITEMIEATLKALNVEVAAVSNRVDSLIKNLRNCGWIISLRVKPNIEGNHMVKCRALAFLTLMGLSAGIAAQTNLAVDKPEPTDMSETNSVELAKTLTDQFQIIRDYNDDFMSIVIWSLSVVATLAVLLIGFNWFQNSRALRREFESLENELRSKLASIRIEFEAALTSKERESSEAINMLAEKLVKDRTESLVRSINSALGRIRELEHKSLEREVAEWMEKKVGVNAVAYARELVEKSVILKDQWRISSALDALNAALTLVAEEQEELDVQSISEVEETIGKLPSTHKIASVAILARLTKMHQK